MLGKKQNISNNEWLEAVSHIELTVSADEIERLAELTVDAIKKYAVSSKKWYGGEMVFHSTA